MRRWRGQGRAGTAGQRRLIRATACDNAPASRLYNGEVAERFKAPVLKFDVGSNGRVAERFKALVLKTSDGQPSVGSNPTPSANKNKYLLKDDNCRSAYGKTEEGTEFRWPNKVATKLSVSRR